MLSKFNLFLRHAIALVRADKLFSTIYVAGTAVGIASAMVIAIFVHILVGDIAPESNRSRTLYLNSNFLMSSSPDMNVFGGFSQEAIDSCFRKMECVKAVVGYSDRIKYMGNKVSDMERQHEILAPLILTNTDFFRLYDFTFLSGRPFSEQEFQDGERVCVITERTAKALSVDTGSSLLMFGKAFRVVGVIKTVSYMLDKAAADIYLPYTEETFDYDSKSSTYAYAGDIEVMILLRKGFTRQDFLHELKPLQQRYEAVASSQAGEEIGWRVIAHSHFFMIFSTSEEESTSLKAVTLIPVALLMLLFLLLPAINLSGLVSNRMEARRAEMGIRKAFGAKRRKLLWEVLFENMVLTLCGGLVGWLLSWLCICAISENAVFLTILTRGELHNSDVSLDFQMFFTPTLFIVCFVCCAVLNHMAAFMPAWRSLRKPIVESLNQKR